MAIGAFWLVDVRDADKFFVSRVVLGFFLLVIAIGIYQPAAMMFWAFAGLSWASRPTPPPPSSIGRVISIMLGSLAAGLGFVKVLPFVLYPHFTPPPVTGLATDLPAKLRWFATGPLVDAFNLPFVIASDWFGITVVALVAAGLWLSASGRGTIRAIRFALLIVLIPLGYLPSLLVGVNGPAHRTQMAMATLVLFYAALGLLAVSRWARAERFLPIFATAAVVACGGMAARNVLVGFALPQANEYRLLAANLPKERRILGAEHLYVRSSRRQDTLAPFMSYDEFGRPSSSDFWGAQSMAWLILHGNPRFATTIQAAEPYRGQPTLPGSAILDVGKALRSTARSL